MNPTTATSTVLVLGANGRFGAAVSLAFAQAGWRVLAQSRRPLLPELAAHPGVTPLRLAFDDTAALAAAAPQAAVVIHALNPAYTRWNQEALPLARAAMDLAQTLGATLMMPGNVYNYGSSMPPELDDHTAQNASTRKGAIRVEIESALQTRAEQGLRSVVLRAGDFFGAGRGNWFDMMIVKSLRKGRIDYPGPLDVPHAWNYLPDLARTFVAVAAQRDRLPACSRMNVDGYSLTGAQLVEAIAQAAAALGWQPPAAGWTTRGLPWGLLRMFGPLVPMWRELAEMSYLWRAPHRLSSRGLDALQLDVPATPLSQALQAALLDLSGLIGMPGERASEAAAQPHAA